MKLLQRYTIPYDPYILVRLQNPGGRDVMCNPRELRLRSQICLESQHDDAPFFNGPLRLEAFFYFKPTIKQYEEHQEFPGFQGSLNLEKCLKFLYKIGTQRIFHHSDQITEIALEKIYTKDPRIEFSLFLLE